MTTSFNVNVNDLQFILRQIKIAEASSAAYSAAPKSILQAIMDGYGVTAVNAAQLPAGLRTVDGTMNNLLPGRSEVGAADTLFPRLTDPVFRNDGTVTGIDFNGDGLLDVVNTNYGDAGAALGTQIRSVSDSDPRVISNLIVDMTVNNPSAIDAFLNNPLSMDAFSAYFAGLPIPESVPADPQAWLTNPANEAAANELLKTIPNQSPDIGLSPGFNSWMTFFGQFFDHGLDLVTKGKNGTVYIPLNADDPLYDKGADLTANNVVDAYFVSDPTGLATADLPAVSGVPTAWQAYYETDPTDRSLYAPGAFAPVITATPTAYAVQFNDDGAGVDGLFSTTDDRPNFMALTRATATIDANGVAQHENTTTSWIDQNQTYTSHSAHQVFLREYVRESGVTYSTGKLLSGDGTNNTVVGGIGNWADVKANALEYLGIKLSDVDVHDVPLLVTDQYGKFIAGANGYAQVAVKVTITPASGPVTTVDTYIEGTASGLDIHALTSSNLPTGFLPAGATATVAVMGTGHAFLNDIAHHAAPGMYDSDGNGTKDAAQVADSDQGTTDDLDISTYDDEMLNSHFITGDGRGNENIALTTVHSIFHSEHDRLVDANKVSILESGDLAFINEWLRVDIASLADIASPAQKDALIANVSAWDGERLFQAARFATEMQYQHLVFEEFARRIQPMVDPFIFNSSPDVDPTIVAEFAHTVYRFGHSMLTGTVDRLENDLTLIDGTTDQKSLLAVFLNPQQYYASGTDLAAINANIIRGLSRDVGNEIDEMIVSDVRDNLVGLPLDLGALNIARGRDTGIPSLNETRAQLYNDTGLADLKPYTSWVNFAEHIKNPLSVVNFIAAYGTHSTITSATTVADKRAAAEELVFGIDGPDADGTVPADRLEFLAGTGIYATNLGGLNDVDLWIGGLAEAKNEFGGMLGSTFNYVFEAQMENLQNGDRMYYLTRTQGTNFLNNLEPNTFSDLVMRNTDLGDDYATHLNGALFVTPDHILELDQGIAQEDYREGNASLDPTWALGEPHSVFASKVTRDYTTAVRGETPTVGLDGHNIGGTIQFIGGEHVVLGGTEGNDRLLSDRGIDTLWGDGGNDYLNAGTESDDVFGGEGDDIIEDPFGDDVLRGNQGNDVITSARGADLLFGDEGKDFISLGQDAAEAFGGEGDDFILGGAGKDFILGNEGADWIEGGAGFDTLAGDNSELFFNSPIQGHDVMFNQGDEGDYDAESGDDIMGSGASVFRYEGMFGFDWAIGKGDSGAVDFDAAIPIFTTIPNDILKDRFDQVEGFSGNKFDDKLSGDDRGHKGGGSSAPDSVPTELFADHLLTQEGINRIDGFNAWFGGFDGTDARQTLFGGASPVPGSTPVSTFRDGNIIMGGDGNDSLRGRGGYDLLDGDAYLNVRIKIDRGGTIYSAESLNTDTTAMGQYAGKVFNTDANGQPDFTSPAFGGRSLQSLLLDGTVNPAQMSIVREILTDNTNLSGTGVNVDTAFFQGTFAEYHIEGSTDLNGDGDYNDAGEFTNAIDVNNDGFISVRDRDTGAVGAVVDGVQLSSRGLLTDDHDLLKNVEMLQFADRLVRIAGNNNAATGVVTIEDPTPYDGKVTPYVGQVLKANLSNFSDPDGLTLDSNGMPVGLHFIWQTTEFGSNSGWSDIPLEFGTYGESYTVRSVDPGHVLRAVAVFNDAAGNPERIISAETDNPTAAFSVNENSFAGTIVGLQIPFSVDYDSQSIGGAPPVDVDVTTLYHEIDPLNNADGRFKVIPNGVDFNNLPRYSLVVDRGGPVRLNYEAVQTPVDNQYQVVVNSYSDTPANGGVLVAVRQFTILLNNLEPEGAIVLPTLDLNAFNVTTTNGNVGDNFDTANTAWTETNDGVTGLSAGQIQIDGGNSNQLRFLNGDGAEITRSFNLSGVTSATLSFNVTQLGLDAGETVSVQFAADGVNFNEVSLINTGSSFLGALTTVNLTGSFSANSAVRFVSTAINGTVIIIGQEQVRIDNLNIATVTTTTGPGSLGNDYATTFNENGAAVAIASLPDVTSMDSVMESATVVLTDWQAGDVMSILGALPAGITAAPITNVAGVMTLTLTGAASLAAYETAIGQVRFANTLDNPGDNQRIIQSTVTDVIGTSAVATTTVTVSAVDDPGDPDAERIYTNIVTSPNQIVIPEWVFLANDTDPDSVPDITSVSDTLATLTSSLTTNAGVPSVTLVQTNAADKQFTYAIQGATQSVDIRSDTVGTIGGRDDNQPDILVGDAANSTFDAGTGNDFVFAGAGDDTIQWNVTNAGVTDGRDFVDGQANGATGDRFVITGNNTAEAFNIYTAAAAGTAGITGLRTGTEIVVTRNGTVIAELDNIEEITINTLDVTANNGNGGLDTTPNGDTINVIGNFAPPNTSLNYSTITVNGGAGADKVDITGLTSDHRVVLNTGGGTDAIIGGTRPQDVINVTAPVVVTNPGNGNHPGHPKPLRSITNGSEEENEIDGDDDDNTLNGLGGDDLMRGGSGDDHLNGGSGKDRLYGQNGDDRMVGGKGEDRGVGSSGDDTFVTKTRDGADTYFGGSSTADTSANDTLDMSAILTNIKVNLGSGSHSKGFAETGGVKDVLYGIENFVGGSGNDTIVASAAHNVMDGGAGKDVFVFKSAAKADGDTITSFQAGDKIDVSAFMGHQVTLVNGQASAGQISVSFEQIDGQEFTVLHGNTDSDTNDEFALSIKGHHLLNGSNIV